MERKLRIKERMLVFSRWCNKRYSVFNSLNRVIKISSLSVAYLLFANQGILSAQWDQSSETIRNYELDAVDVSTEQQTDIFPGLSRVVVSITRAEIERAAVSSVNELLEYASNIDIRHRGGHGMQSDVSIRGGSFDQVLILLNGVNITDPQTGHHNLNLPLQLSSIERVEVLKGPGAWKFGPGAFSGAINIVTITPGENYLNIDLEAGQYAYNMQNLSGGVNTEKSSHLISANRSSSDGYTENTDFSLLNLFYTGNYTIANGNLQLQGGATDKAFGANSFYTAMFPNQYEEIQTYYASINYKKVINKLVLEPGVYYRRNNDRFLLFRDNPPLYSNYHTSDVYGLNLMAAVFHNNNGVSTFGAGTRSETIYSNNLGVSTLSPRYSTVNDTILLDKYHSRTNLSLYAGHKQYFGKLMINAGLNLTHNTDFAGKWFFFPGIDLSYQLGSSSTLSASANKTMRMPTFTDLYYTSPNNQGNPALLPEEALGFEAGYNYSGNVVKFSLTGFVMRGENMIDWVRANVNEKWQTINYTQLNTLGAETMLHINLREAIPGNKILNNIRLAYTFIEMDKDEAELISNYSLNYLKHRFDLTLTHVVWRNIDAIWHMAYQDRNGGYEKIENRQSLGMIEYEPFLTYDLKIRWKHKGWQVFGSINNLFNTEYFDIGNVPQPGRWVKIGVSKKLNFD